jgi:ATP-dependent DNA helicase RecG
LDLTEGRSTGVPTIQEKLAANGSPRATFETTDDRLTFLIHIPIHAGCENNLLVLANKKQSAGSEKISNSSEKISNSSEMSSEKGRTGSDKPQDVVQSILNAIRKNPKVSAAEIAMKVGLSSRAVEKRIKTMRENGIIRRVGPDRGGYWEIIE